MDSFFTTKDPLNKIIEETFADKKVLSTKHILTGWTNIVIEVETDAGNYFFRFVNAGQKQLTVIDHAVKVNGDAAEGKAGWAVCARLERLPMKRSRQHLNS